MEFRYFINNHWKKEEVIAIMEALEFSARYFKLTKGVTTVKLISIDEMEATADRLKNNRFEIRLNKTKLITLDEILRAVFHEMTHIKQFIFDDFRPGMKWKGVPVAREQDYWLSPWEMEARAMEEPMLHFYKHEN